MAPAQIRPSLLLTRPQAGSEQFAAMFRAEFGTDWPIIVSPLTGIAPVVAEIPPADALIFTSQHAVAEFAAQQSARGRIAYCVGARTAQAAAEAGFVPRSAQGDARDLVDLIRADHRGGRLLHVRGAEVAMDLAGALGAAGIAAQSVILYRQVDLAPSDAAGAALRGKAPILVPLFSPNAARRFVQILPRDPAPLFVAALSENVAKAVAEVTFERTEIAPRPESSGMLAALHTLLRG